MLCLRKYCTVLCEHTVATEQVSPWAGRIRPSVLLPGQPQSRRRDTVERERVCVQHLEPPKVVDCPRSRSCRSGAPLWKRVRVRIQ